MNDEINLDERMSSLEKAFEAHKADMAPVIEFFKTINSVNKFLKWGGLTMAGILAMMYYLIKR